MTGKSSSKRRKLDHERSPSPHSRQSSPDHNMTPTEMLSNQSKTWRPDCQPVRSTIATQSGLAPARKPENTVVETNGKLSKAEKEIRLQWADFWNDAVKRMIVEDQVDGAAYATRLRQYVQYCAQVFPSNTELFKDGVHVMKPILSPAEQEKAWARAHRLDREATELLFDPGFDENDPQVMETLYAKAKVEKARVLGVEPDKIPSPDVQKFLD